MKKEKLKQNDWCFFWNENIKKGVVYQFFEYSKHKHPYVSIDKSDDNDLSWWLNDRKLTDEEFEQIIDKEKQ